MILLHQFPPAFGLSSMSPFCTKVEVYLRLSGLEHKVVSGSPLKAPNGKLPYVVDEGQLIPDSSSIIDHCRAKHGDPLDAGLSPAQHAKGHLLQRITEEHLYWVMVYWRWLDASGWAVYKPVVSAMLPPVLRWFLPFFIRKGLRKTLRAQGLGRHAPEEMWARGVADINAISELIPQQGFLMGERPSSYDCGVYAFMQHVLRFPASSALKEAAQRHETIGAYCDRIRGEVGM